VLVEIKPPLETLSDPDASTVTLPACPVDPLADSLEIAPAPLTLTLPAETSTEPALPRPEVLDDTRPRLITEISPDMFNPTEPAFPLENARA